MDVIAGFDPSTMTYLATQMAHPSVDPFHEMLLPVEMQESTYAYTEYVGDTAPAQPGCILTSRV